MLSILIPVYNYNVVPLVKELHRQASLCNISFEILVYNDGSPQYITENKTINSLSKCLFKELPENIGRSAIRNKLAASAQYEFPLFLDADVAPCNDLFIKKYLDMISSKTTIISGGLRYKKNRPDKDQMLRWKYGHIKESVSVKERKKKPYLSFLSSNFLIRKSVFEKIYFNEKIPNLPCEDTVFGLEAKKKKIFIDHIDNPIFHLGLETSSIFLKKSMDSIEVRQSLIKKKILQPKDTRITDLAHKIEKIKLRRFILILHSITKNIFRKNLISDNPSLRIFDFYRLGHYFYIQEKK